MIKAYMAFTSEVDDIGAAVAEITERLAGAGALLQNTVGIVSCYAGFVASGVFRAVCDALPFDVVGATTLGAAAEESDDEIVLTLMVMTSDDVVFAAGIADPVDGADDGALRAAYARALAGLDQPPALMLSFAPLLMNVGGDYFVRTFDEITGGVPNFGTLAVDHNEDYHQAAVLYNGASYPAGYGFILLSGDVRPEFYIASVSSEKLFGEKGVVTESCGSQLRTVNHIPVVDYLTGLGLQKNDDGSIPGINTFPFIVDHNDGTTPVVRCMFALTPEGYAACGGEIPVGATLAVGSIDAADVVRTTERRVGEALSSPRRHDCMLIYSCVGRYFFLGYDPTEEIRAVQTAMKGSGIPYLFAYSGCELCPVYGEDTTANRSHNITCVICAL